MVSNLRRNSIFNVYQFTKQFYKAIVFCYRYHLSSIVKKKPVSKAAWVFMFYFLFFLFFYSIKQSFIKFAQNSNSHESTKTNTLKYLFEYNFSFIAWRHQVRSIKHSRTNSAPINFKHSENSKECCGEQQIVNENKFSSPSCGLTFLL